MKNGSQSRNGFDWEAARVPPRLKVWRDRAYAIAAPKWAYNPTMQAIRNGFLLTLPLIMAACIALLVNNLPIPAYQRMMAGLFGTEWKEFGLKVWQGTFGIIALPMLFGISQHLTIQHNQRHGADAISPIIAALVAFSSLVVILPIDNNDWLPVVWTGPSGLFVGMVVALCATRLFLFLARRRFLRLTLHAEGADTMIPQAFMCLIPGILTVAVFTACNFLFVEVTGSNLNQFVHDLVLYPFSLFADTLGTSVAYVFVSQSFWFIGIHGANVLDPVTHQYYQAAMQANLAAHVAGQPMPHLVTKLMLDVFVYMGGSGSAISLLLALGFASRNNSSRRLAQLSMIPGVFNINELLLFGLPVILNPVFLLPFIAVPMLLLLVSYYAIALGIVPGPFVQIDWTTPPLISGFVATGSIKGSLLQCFNIALGVVIYLPFVRISDRLKQERMKLAMKGLMRVASSNAVGPLGKKCLDRDDEIGALARVLANDLRASLKTGEGLFLEYQPQIEHLSGKVIGVEALIRWRHPVYGLIPAPVTVTIAEDGDFIKRLGLWVFDQACAERRRWQAAGLSDDFEASVNVSVRQLDDADLPRKFAECLEKHRLRPSMIGLEVTESVALDPDANHNTVLHRLSELGLGISIDDFGMGHSSLLYLKHFPVSALKIDKALSKDVAVDRTCLEIISTIVELCKALKVHIVVEFIETVEQIELLRNLDCHIFQGYYFSKPLAGEAALAYALRKNAAIPDA
jgi:lactose/cellobiose-specific phosphotransferase system IIC component